MVRPRLSTARYRYIQRPFTLTYVFFIPAEPAPLIDEFGWDRGFAAGAFSFSFLAAAALSPVARPAGRPG
jgi:hypothetical protein